MTHLFEITSYLDSVLQNDKFADASQNGLQIEADIKEIQRVAVAVDAAHSIFEKAIDQKAQLLIVHHGLFWGQAQNLTGTLAKKISLLMKNGCSLYASHLPLDSHMRLGNAAQIAGKLGLQNLQPFCEYKGSTVGVKATAAKAMDIEWFKSKCSGFTGAIKPLLLPFGVKEIKNVAIVSGSGAFAIPICAQEKIDLLISGEAKHEAYHQAKELGINALFAGHYATETFGVLALAQELKDKFNLDGFFIDETSGI